MEKEQVAVDEAVETVAEENARAYSKTVWNESTPITADKLNKIEDGIASALPISGGTLTGKIDVPGESTFYRDTYVDPWENTGCVIKASGNVGIGGSLKVNESIAVSQNVWASILEANTDFVLNRHGFRTYYTNNEHGSYIYCDKNSSYINLKDNKMVYGNPNGSIEIGPQNAYHCHINTDKPTFYFNTELLVNGNSVWHAGNFNPGTKLDAGYFSISNRDLLIHGKRAMVGFNTGDGNYLSLNYERDFGAGVRIHGLTLIDSIETGGKLAFSSIGTGGGLNANIHNLALHNSTGNGQMMTADFNRIYVGNPNTPLTIESSSNPIVNVGGREYQLYHTGNKPTAGDIGALPLSGGTMNGTIYMESGGHTRRRIASIASHGGTDLGDNNSRTTVQSNKVPTWWNGSNNRAMLVFDTENPSDYIVRCGAGLGGAAGYITFSW